MTKFLFIPLFFCFSSLSFSQQETWFGVMATAEEYPDRGIRFGAGLVLDQKITKRSGFEFGIFSRSMLRNSSFIADFPDGTTKRLFTNIRMNYLTIPLVYKFYSRIANISIGPTLDAYVGWKQVGGTPGVETTEFSTSRKTILGAMAKISKRFTLSEDLILEPDIRLNPLFSVERTYVGAAISLKYRIPKRLISE